MTSSSVSVSFGNHASTDRVLGRSQRTAVMHLSPEILLGTVVGLTASALWAVSVVVYRSQRDAITPIGIASVKMWVALAFMTLLVFISAPYAPVAIPMDAVFYISLSVTMGAVMGDTLYLMAQERIGVSYAYPIAMSHPILTYYFAILLVDEPFILSRFMGTIMTVVGIVVISIESNNHDEDATGDSKMDLVGIALALVTMLLWALCAVVLQIGAANVGAIEANFVRVVVGSIEFVPICLIARHRGMPTPTRRATEVVAFAAIFGMAIGSLLFVLMVQLLNAALASVVGSTSSLFALPISVLYLKEKVTRKALAGVMLAVVGVILAVVAI